MGRLAAIPLPPLIPGRITVVGVCGAGKSSLVAELCARGYDAHECLQEHSFLADMWRRVSRPQVLVMLHAARQTLLSRSYSYVSPALYQDQINKLAHACAHAQIYVNTDNLEIQSVGSLVLSYLALHHIPSRF